MLKTVVTKAITATPQTIQLPRSSSGWTLRNDDAMYSIFYISDPSTYPIGKETAFAGASKAILKALGASELRAGEAIVIDNLTPTLVAVCITGGTASMDIEAGAISAAATPKILKAEVVTITAASATLKSLLAGAAYRASVKSVSIKTAGPWSFAIGAAAVMGAVTLDAGIVHEIPCTADTDLRVIAGGSVAAFVEQEG